MNHDETYKKAREAYGLQFELGMLQEECAELIVACSKLMRFPKDPGKLIGMLNEIADVENLLEQMKQWFPDSREFIERKRNEKMIRLAKRIEEDYEHKDL